MFKIRVSKTIKNVIVRVPSLNSIAWNTCALPYVTSRAVDNSYSHVLFTFLNKII